MYNKEESYRDCSNFLILIFIIIVFLISFNIGVQCGKLDERQRIKIKYQIGELK